MTANLQPRELVSILQQDVGSTAPAQFRADERRTTPRRVEDRLLQQIASMARWMIELDGRAVFLLDRAAHIVVSNSAAQQLCQDDSWVQMGGGKLSFAMPSMQGWLQQAMSSADRRSSLPCGSADSRTLIRLHHVAHTVTERAEGVIETVEDDTNDLFMLTIGDSPPSTVLREDLRAAFGLTAAEAAVAAELYTGKSLARVAEVLGLSVNTVKTHVKRVFRKCSVRSHVQLVKRIDGIC